MRKLLRYSSQYPPEMTRWLKYISFRKKGYDLLCLARKRKIQVSA
jgi:hypothetical protein